MRWNLLAQLGRNLPKVFAADRISHQSSDALPFKQRGGPSNLSNRKKGNPDQGMQPIRDFDHLMCGVRDIEAVGHTFETLGFTVGPVTPLEGVGVVNRRILLTPKQKNIANYMEFMQLGGTAGEIPSYLQKWLAGSLKGEEGAHCMIMRTDDSHFTFAHFMKRHEEEPDGGFEPVLLELEFEQKGPHGERYTVDFSNCIFPDLEPPLYLSTSEIRSLDFYLNPFWRTHRNGALSWVSTIAVADDPFATATALQDIWGGTVTKLDGGIVVGGPGEMPLTIFAPDRFYSTYGVIPEARGEIDRQAYIAGVHISVSNLSETREFLSACELDVITKEDCVIVPPELAHGLLLCFEQDEGVG